uniref:Ig-like domain-containing protein n=1 Tax=Oreochromis niloticus TaxID=8128 RepID=A0A669BSJ2_ORENI
MCKKNVFMYSTVGGDALLPCMASSDCSAISWTFFNKGTDVRFVHEVVNGKVTADSDKSSRMTFTSNCSISLRNLRVRDAGSYVCLKNDQPVTDVYLSLLTISSFSTFTDLQPGGILTLTCIFFTYYDAGSCKSYSKSSRNVQVNTGDERQLCDVSLSISPLCRYNLNGHTRCNITLVTKLQKEDNNRRWRCLVNTTESSRAVFLDFRSAFLFQNNDDDSLNPSVTAMCQVKLPISRIVLCVALPIMVTIVAFFTWKSDRERAKASAESFMLHEIN